MEEQHRLKIKEANIGKHRRGMLKEETIDKLHNTHLGSNNGMYGKHHSTATRRLISGKIQGRTATEETRKRMSEAHRGKRLTEEHRKSISFGVRKRRGLQKDFGRDSREGCREKDFFAPDGGSFASEKDVIYAKERSTSDAT